MKALGLIVAAGSSQRFGGGLPKQFLPLGGRPLLAWSLTAFDASPAIEGLVVVVAPDQLERASAICAATQLEKPLRLCAGGGERTDSVRAGLAALPASARLVAIHDAARPLVTPELIARAVAGAAREGAAFPALPILDTIHRASDGLAHAPVDRAGLVLAQTPQVFRVELIRAALARDRAATDEVQLLEASGHPVLVVEGDPRNFKITFPADLALAEALLGSDLGRDPGPRVGVGYDVHELVAGRRLVLGGVVLPFERGLLGHSDADVLCHAIGDALLGASALGDLGTHFPPGDPSTEGISSLELLRQIAALLAGAGLRIGNLDATVVCERPRLAPHLQAIRVALGSALGLDPARIGIKATTSERLGFTGRGEGIAAIATALLFQL